MRTQFNTRRRAMNSKCRRLHVEGLESRQLLAGDLAQAGEESSCLIGDSNLDGRFDEPDLIRVFQAGKYETGVAATWEEGDWNGDGWFDSSDLILAFSSGNYGVEPENVGPQLWPDVISLPTGLEPEGITLGKGQEFFVGAFSYSSFFGPLFDIFDHPESTLAGAVFKGDLRTGEGQILVQPTENLQTAGLSYDARTDYLYAVTKDATSIIEPSTGEGVSIYNGTTGELVKRYVFGEGMGMNDVFVTNKAVYATDSYSPTLYKIPLDRGGKPSTAWEAIHMDGFDMIDGDLNANGLVGDFDGDELVVVNVASGILYHVDTESGAATAINVQGEQNIFPSGDGLYMQGRTLYIMQNEFDTGGPGKIAVVQLSTDLTGGTFVKDITSDDFANPVSIVGFGDSIYALNSQGYPFILGNPSTVQSQVVKVKK